MNLYFGHFLLVWFVVVDCPQPIYANTSTLNSQEKTGMADTSDGKTEEQSAPSPHQSLLRSASFPVQVEMLKFILCAFFIIVISLKGYFC